MDPLILRFDFSTRKIELRFEEESGEHGVLFDEVSNLSFDKFHEVTNFNGLEIYNADFTEESGFIHAKILFLQGSGLPSWELRFSFQQYTIQ